MGGRSRTTVVNNNIYRAPSAPPAQQVISSGSISGSPQSASIGSTRFRSSPPDFPGTSVRYNSPPNAWNTVPFVVHLQPATPVSRPVQNQNVQANVDIASAQTARATVCEAILTDPSVGLQDWTLVGNGAALRFRFPLRGAPNEVTITNLSTGAALASSAYTVTVRGDSFSWLEFNVAPADGISHKVSFSVGDSGVLRTVTSNNWNAWNLTIRAIETNIASVKDAVLGSNSNARYVGGSSAASWNLSDPTLIGDAEQGVADLKAALKRPGQKMDTGQIAGICAYLNSQLSRIESNLSRSEYIGGVRCATPSVAIYRNTDATISSRIYNNDIRYNYISGPNNDARYQPPNSRVPLAVSYKKSYDVDTGRYYYSI
jgi:hypothetical protein